MRVSMAIIGPAVLYAITLVAIIVPTLGQSKNQLLDRLGQASPTTEQVKYILKSVRDKDNVIIGGLSVRTILEHAKKNDLSEAYCQPNHISLLLQDTCQEDLNSVLNVYNFMTAHNEQLQSFCARNIRQFFTDRQLLTELEPKDLKADEAREILGCIGDKKNVKIGLLSVQEILDQESKDFYSPDDCQYDAIKRRNSYVEQVSDDFNPDLVENVRNFDKPSFQKLITFCAHNIVQVFKASITDKDEKDVGLLFSADDENEDSWHISDEDEFDSQMKELCDRLLVKSIGNVERIEGLSTIKMPEGFRKELNLFKINLERSCSKIDTLPDLKVAFRHLPSVF